ncbi:SIS domain-containing protein, partial [Staphylococcus lugdunensis]|uniref:MurR/RpiR family transcriptional regulator n=1 Tax=Staphylococcus lugdunensis TaxID=28035 RepID=UPI0030C2D6C7
EEALQKSSTFADNTTIDTICQHFKRANNIFIFGYGASYVCATDLYQKLSRIGLNIQLVHETHIFTTMLATRNSNDCVIFISNNGTQSEMQSIAKVIADYH